VPYVLENGWVRYGATCSNMFKNCSSFNSPVYIGLGYNSCENMFRDCINFNSVVTFYTGEVNTTNAQGLSYSLGNFFANCTNFNLPVILPEITYGVANMFSGCTNFNSPVTLPNYGIKLNYLFANTPAFNQPVYINNGFNTGDMFYNATSFNSPVTISNNFSGLCSSMFAFAVAFNQDIYFPKYAHYCDYLFRGATNFGKNVYFNSVSGFNAVGMFSETNNSLRKNVFFNPICTASFNGNQSHNSIVAREITWTTMTNRFYNAAYNIYCYNNYVV
jgi:hypothetical protein